MTMITGSVYGASLSIHDDGRVTVTRSVPGLGTFVHVELEPQEIKAIQEMEK